ncbi:hypothetical protein KI387_023033 [Taxus chinensis]|uniref:WIT1/2 N-terminal helical bundle domain-containing protein n=1 Tax=Taxus chinensis TaxID=29808 RepID=A0AA38L7M4_TAXCH|nr:hypothetical protein KI387_023033 [Taxus chinensis]
METKTVDGSDIVEIVPDEESQNYVKSDMLPEHDAVSVSEFVEEAVEAEPVENGASSTDNKASDVEENLNISEKLTADLEEKLTHTKENEEEIIFPKNVLNNDALNEQERLKDFELQPTMWTMSFSDSASDVLQLNDGSNLSDKLEEITKYALTLKEKELVSQEKLANAELKIKGLEDRLEMQSRHLEQEMKIRALEEDELEKAKAMSSRLETDSKCLKEEVLNLEGQLKSSRDKNEEYKKLVEQNEENCIESFERALELDNLLVISDSRTKEMEKLLVSLQNEISGIYQKQDPNKHRQEPLNGIEPELLKVEEQSMHSINGLRYNEKSEDSLVKNKELEAALLATRKKEQELLEALIVAEERISSYEEMAKSSACTHFEVENLAEVLQGTVKDAQVKIRTLELELENALGREIKLQTRLKDSEAPISMQENFAHVTAKVKELEHLFELQANDAETKLQAEKENGACADTEVRKLRKNLNLLVDCVKESEDQASQAYASEIAKELELQVLYAKLAEINIIVQNIQARFMVAETRAVGAEAEWSALTYTNSKLNEELTNVQAYMDEIQTTLHRIDSEKQLVVYQLISTTKNINSLTKQLADERQRLQKEISTLVRDNLDLTRKYLNVKEDLNTILSNHQIHQKKSNAQEETVTENSEDLKSGCRKSSSIDMHITDLQQKLQFGENKLQQDVKGLAADSGNFGRSLLFTESTNLKTERHTVPVSGFGSIIKSMSVVVLVLVIGLVIAKLV